MTRKIKTLCLAVMAMLAIGALSASAASATELVYEAEGELAQVTLSGTNGFGNDVIKMEGGTVQCNTELHGIVTFGVSSFELTPTFTVCKAFGFEPATVNPEKCKFKYNLKEKTAEHVFRSEMDVVCPPGESIKISSGTCKVEITAQTGLKNAKWIDDTTAPSDLTLNYEITGMAYTVTADGFQCPFGGTGAKKDGEYTTNVKTTIKGTDPNNVKTVIPIKIQ